MDNFNFDKNQPKLQEKLIEDKALKRKVKNEEIHTARFNQLKQLCVTPQKNEQWRIITEKQFNAYALIKLMIEEQKTIDELYLAIYRINEPTVNSIIEMIDSGKIKKATFIISNFFNQTKKPEKWARKLREYCDNSEQCNHVYVHNHSKVVCVKSNDNYFVFEGSGNMSDNARIEQYVYENNEQMYNFHKNWMDELIKNEGRWNK